MIITEYVRRHANLYGIKSSSSDIHSLRHLPDAVKKFSPLWTTSCAPFENLNGIFKKFVHGSKHAHLQVHAALNNYMCLTNLMEKYLDPLSPVYTFCKNLSRSGTHRHKLTKINSETYAIRKISKPTKIPCLISQSFSFQVDINKCLLFNKLLKLGIEYEVEACALKKNDSC